MDASSSARSSYGFPLSVAMRTDTGIVRPDNEDSAQVEWLSDGSLLVVVADGMGGHQAGEVASGLAVKEVVASMAESPEGEPAERLSRAIVEANDEIYRQSHSRKLRGMGTTVVGVLCRGARAYVAHVGDSRAWWLRGAFVKWRTRDHTRVQELVDIGFLEESAARTHPASGMLTRALGHPRMNDGRDFEPDLADDPIELEPGDAIIVTSDGAHDLLEPHELEIAVSGATAEEAVGRIVGMALSRGGHDNITVAVIVAGDRAKEFPENNEPTEEEEAPPPPTGAPTIPPREEAAPKPSEVPTLIAQAAPPESPTIVPERLEPAPRVNPEAPTLQRRRPGVPMVTLLDLGGSATPSTEPARRVSPSWDPTWPPPADEAPVRALPMDGVRTALAILVSSAFSLGMLALAFAALFAAMVLIS